MRKRIVLRKAGTRTTNTQRMVTTPAILRQRRTLTAKVRQAERLIHTISQLTAKLA